jgi:hypothetical protein
VTNWDRGSPAPEGVGFCVLYPEEGRSLDLRRDSYKKKIKAHGVLAADLTITSKSMVVSRAKIPNENRVKKLSRYTPCRRLGERSYSSYSFTTSALDGGEWST